MTDQNRIGMYLFSPAEKDLNGEEANLVDGLFAISRGLESIAKALRDLSIIQDDDTEGALAVLSQEIRDGFTDLAVAITKHANQGVQVSESIKGEANGA